MNRPSAVGHLYRFATRNSLDDASAAKEIDIPSAVNKAALMRESALKSVIFVGVPRVGVSSSTSLMFAFVLTVPPCS